MENVKSYIEDGKLWVCQHEERGRSVGLLNGDDPTKFPVSLFLLQIALVSSFSAFFHFLFKPFGQSNFIPQMLGGIVLGPSVLGLSKKFNSKFFYTRIVFLIDTYESLAFLFIGYLSTIHMDVGIIKKAGKVAVVNGIVLFVFPYIVALSFPNILKKMKHSTLGMRNTMTEIATVETTTSFQVFFGVLSDLKMLNSELGRLVLSLAMISNLIGWLYAMVGVSIANSKQHGKIMTMVLSLGSKVAFVLVIIFVFRPILLWMMKKTPEGKPLKHSYVCWICLMVLLSGFLGDLTGMSPLLGGVILGMVTPSRPPLGPNLTDKIGCIVEAILMPCWLIAVGRRVNVFGFSVEDVLTVELLIIVVQTAKFVAVFVPSLYYKLPLSHATTLGLIVNIQGFFDVQIFKGFMNHKVITNEGFSIMVISAMVHSTILTIVVRNLHQPTHKYIAYQRRTVQHLRPDARLGILACFNNQEAVPLILNILEISNPSRGSPISVFALNLEKLEDRTVPVLIQHRLDKKPSLIPNRTDRIIKAFNSYERQNQGVVSVQCFTAVSPYLTMHDDVCSLALETCANLVIVGVDKEDRSLLQRVSRNILENAPCSVAILYDRGGLPDFRSVVLKHLRIKTCVVFLGGSDDREVLAYGSRMADHPSVNLRVLRLVDVTNLSGFGDLIERKLDMNAINQFRTQTVSKENVEYRETRIAEACHLLEELRKMKDEFDLVMVGIKREENSSVLEGLSEWSEMKELGVIGDLLASKDIGLRASVLAVQQQSLVVKEMVGSSSMDYVKRSVE